MSDSEKDSKSEGASVPPEPNMDNSDVTALLKRAMRVDAVAPPNVLAGVQRRIRQRSRGKFFADGWSTSASPKSTYFVTSLVMLAMLVLLYFALVPGGWGTP
jgi:hypothetical protein